MIAYPVGPHEEKPIGGTLTWQEPEDFSTLQNTPGTSQPVHSLPYCDIDDSFLVFSVTLPVRNGQM